MSLSLGMELALENIKSSVVPGITVLEILASLPLELLVFIYEPSSLTVAVLF